MKTYRYVAVVEYDKGSKMYIGSIPSLPGALTQGKSIDEVEKNLKEVADLILTENPEYQNNHREMKYVGSLNIEVRH